MNTDFPIPITTATDLEFYENFLKQEFKITPATSFIQNLKSYIGSLVKIEYTVGNRIEAKTGWLLEVGEDFILLKQMQTGQKTLLRSSVVKFVTLLKNNVKNPHL